MKALIDSGSQENYVSAHAVFKAGLRLLRKQKSYLLHVANGQPMPDEARITHEVSEVELRIQEH
jgi:hypothetical protein